MSDGHGRVYPQLCCANARRDILRALIAHDDTYIFSFAADTTPERDGIVTDFSKKVTVTVFEGVTLYAALSDRLFAKEICSALIDRAAKLTVCSIAAITEQTGAEKNLTLTGCAAAASMSRYARNSTDKP